MGFVSVMKAITEMVTCVFQVLHSTFYIKELGLFLKKMAVKMAAAQKHCTEYPCAAPILAAKA